MQDVQICTCVAEVAIRIMIRVPVGIERDNNDAKINRCLSPNDNNRTTNGTTENEPNKAVYFTIITAVILRSLSYASVSLAASCFSRDRLIDAYIYLAFLHPRTWSSSPV